MVCLCSVSTRDRDWRMLACSSLRTNGKSRQSIILNCDTWIWSLRCWEGEQFIYLFYVKMVLVWCDSCSITFQILLNRPIFYVFFIPSCFGGAVRAFRECPCSDLFSIYVRLFEITEKIISEVSPMHDTNQFQFQNPCCLIWSSAAIWNTVYSLCHDWTRVKKTCMPFISLGQLVVLLILCHLSMSKTKLNKDPSGRQPGAEDSQRPLGWWAVKPLGN